MSPAACIACSSASLRLPLARRLDAAVDPGGGTGFDAVELNAAVDPGGGAGPYVISGAAGSIFGTPPGMSVEVELHAAPPM